MYWKPKPELYYPYLRSRILKGRGIGEGNQYQPWLKVRDVPSRGTSGTIAGLIVDRPHHVLSELEATYLYLLERKPNIRDIREQWPIFDIDETLTLCRKYSVKHPYRGKYPEPFTIDFMITEEVAGELIYKAVSIKTPKDAVDPKVRKRLNIEYRWASCKGISWQLADCTNYTKTALSNLRFMRSWFAGRVIPQSDDVLLFIDVFYSIYRANVLLSEILEKVAKTMKIDSTHATMLFQYCAWKAFINVSLDHALALNRPLVLNELNESF
ncbi:TnsA endonuclease N-terminal domain-containing protein [Herminiimonas contaminans]|uniref:Tn7 transposase TnsA N-terminal domain-containing protein n=1 Tax=Herminiimonas contaminans TaxID=1111140 RepID=A0ABS0ET63_9BURK|nr:TnsA endonuclease N-terminal domain-containing protein [Herminiimonas contaminans]MBF8178036.1 Tn7 transposase TnsA N-terminal domain-containing protein [Herminiimonas contaminans]